MMKTAMVEELLVPVPRPHPLEIERLFKPEEGAGASMLSGTPEVIARQMADLLVEHRLVR